MKRNRLLEIIQANTSPITEEEFNAFLLRRHGTTSRENASADLSILDEEERKFLKIEVKTQATESREQAVAAQETESK